MSYQSYNRVQQRTSDPRSVEYQLLAQVTVALTDVQDKQANDAPTKARLYDAILWNRQVWDAFMVDLADERNALPKELRARLISIALWVSRETGAIMDGQGDLGALIGVNRNIMQGLR
jgi:flagellar protein FlaF